MLKSAFDVTLQILHLLSPPPLICVCFLFLFFEFEFVYVWFFLTFIVTSNALFNMFNSALHTKFEQRVKEREREASFFFFLNFFFSNSRIRVTEWKTEQNVAQVYQFSAAFFGFFALQMVFAQDKLFEMNFDPVPKLDKWHVWMFRGLGVLGLNICWLTYTWSKSEADMKRYVSFMATLWFTFSSALPWYAQKNLPVKQEHLIPTIGCALITLGFVYHSQQSSKSKSK